MRLARGCDLKAAWCDATVQKSTLEEPIKDFRPLAEMERRRLIAAVRVNADRELAILMDPRDTSFVGMADEVPDEEVIRCIQSVPCHY